MGDDDYVFDEASGAWIGGDNPPREVATADVAEARDSVGNRLADGGQVALIKDLAVKGPGQTLKRGTLVKVDPANRRPSGNRLQIQRDQGIGPARRIRSQALIAIINVNMNCVIVDTSNG